MLVQPRSKIVCPRSLKCRWVCYILFSKNPKHSRATYNGATVNFQRRLRQHNGDIKGGAKYTRGKGPWEPLCIISGFHSKQEALQAEWRIKKVTNQRRRPQCFCSPEGRLRSLSTIFQRSTFTSKSQRTIADGTFTIAVHPSFKSTFDEMSHLPSNVSVITLGEEDNTSQ